jgi:hypothetical protein
MNFGLSDTTQIKSIDFFKGIMQYRAKAWYMPKGKNKINTAEIYGIYKCKDVTYR